MQCRAALVGMMLLASVELRAQAPAPRAGETPAAREQARLCERLRLLPGVDACRAALALGIDPARRAALRDQLARQLVALEDWEALADHFREGTRLEPHDAVSWRRLGETLLFALHRLDPATSALEQAVALAPEDAEARLDLAEAHLASGRVAEARAAFEAALRLDPQVTDGRPAARAGLEAARRGSSWP